MGNGTTKAQRITGRASLVFEENTDSERIVCANAACAGIAGAKEDAGCRRNEKRDVSRALTVHRCITDGAGVCAELAPMQVGVRPFDLGSRPKSNCDSLGGSYGRQTVVSAVVLRSGERS